jgi:hypothetical protein
VKQAMQNKILMDGNIYKLDNNNLNIDVKNDSKIYINDEILNYKIDINLLDNAKLEMYIYTTKETNNSIKISLNNNTSLKVFHTFDIDSEFVLNLDTVMLGNNNLCDIHISGITRNLVKLNIDGIVNSNTENNTLNESIKVLTRGGKVISSPMLHVSTKNVLANHGNSISNIDKEQLFYLMSKGITKDKSIELIEDSYKYGLFKNNDDYIKYINI